MDSPGWRKRQDRKMGAASSAPSWGTKASRGTSLFNQQITQLGVNAGVSAKNLGAFSAAVLKVSDSTGLAATSVGCIHSDRLGEPEDQGDHGVFGSYGPKCRKSDRHGGRYRQRRHDGPPLRRRCGKPDVDRRRQAARVLDSERQCDQCLGERSGRARRREDVRPHLVARLGDSLPVAKTFGLNLNSDRLPCSTCCSRAWVPKALSDAVRRLPSACSERPQRPHGRLTSLFGANATTTGSTSASKAPRHAQLPLGLAKRKGHRCHLR